MDDFLFSAGTLAFVGSPLDDVSARRRPMRVQSEISRHRHVRGSRRDGRGRDPFDPTTQDEARVAAKAMVDALADILRSERS
jgi:hypothetical protein